METNEKLIEALNGLIEINNDRVNGYEKAIEESKDLDVDLKTIFNGMASESRKYAGELTKIVSESGGTPADGTTTPINLLLLFGDNSALLSCDRRAKTERRRIDSIMTNFHSLCWSQYYDTWKCAQM